MQTFLRRLGLAQPSILRWNTLCSTVAGHACDLLTITEYQSPPEDLDTREYVVLTGRVHPGETSASWVMQVRKFTDVVSTLTKLHFIDKLLCRP